MLDVKIDIEQALKDLADYEKSVENRVVQEIRVTGQAVRDIYQLERCTHFRLPILIQADLKVSTNRSSGF